MVAAYLRSRHPECRVVRAKGQKVAALRRYLRRPVKSDRIDALTLAKMPFIDPERLDEVYLAPAQTHALQRLTRQRKRLEDQITTHKKRIGSIVDGYLPGVRQAFSHSWSVRVRAFIHSQINPFAVIRAGEETMRTLTPAEVEVLFDALQDNSIYPVTYTAVSTGLREAELLGLRWRDIDLDMLSISVSQALYKRRGVCQFKEPKTAHSRRRIAMTPKLALFLREYKADRESLYWQLGQPLSLDSLVFGNPEGKPLDPSILSHEFARIAKKAGLENVRFHDLRHTFASLMFFRGAKPKVISEALGHSSVAFTMDVYSHIIEGMQEDAMALLDEVLPAGISRKYNANLTPTSPKTGGIF